MVINRYIGSCTGLGGSTRLFQKFLWGRNRFDMHFPVTFTSGRNTGKTLQKINAKQNEGADNTARIYVMGTDEMRRLAENLKKSKLNSNINGQMNGFVPSENRVLAAAAA